MKWIDKMHLEIYKYQFIYMIPRKYFIIQWIISIVCISLNCRPERAFQFFGCTLINIHSSYVEFFLQVLGFPTKPSCISAELHEVHHQPSFPPFPLHSRFCPFGNATLWGPVSNGKLWWGGDLPWCTFCVNIWARFKCHIIILPSFP